VCVTRDGRSLVGRIAAETNATVTMRRVGVPDQTVRRGDIEELIATGKSVMPDGLENGLSVPDLADLLEFLQMPDVQLLPDGAGIFEASGGRNK
jgi:putative heme-binding domain-containing protein